MDKNINIHACSQICKHINIPVNLHTHNYTNVFQCPAYGTEGGGSWPCQPDAHRNLTPVFYRLHSLTSLHAAQGSTRNTYPILQPNPTLK